ncbi:XRE family transcriptional regulator [Streptomyces silvisoli]|uniref:XRE family transcriptional regulator n=1 Tax=Streptomyces silvisoli TaxID=3034235 RepID=A0ABT5ZNQ4_9ACTN|nr:XRE family transcriptional regulator [Streptomyces silvisoli]MDF3291291.1 XRE family transcriptional regulator [Streptomyces silvisoli]
MIKAMGDQAPATGPRTIAQKLDYLIREIHPKGRGPFTYQEIADQIRQRANEGDPTVSHGTVQAIRTGKVTNPGVDSLRALAAFFGVPTAYFLDDTVSGAVEARIREIKQSAEQADAGDELADALQDREVRAVAFRLSGLSAKSLRGIKGIVEGFRQAEGLPEVKPQRTRRRRG